MFQPDELKTQQPLDWSPGTGAQEWGVNFGRRVRRSNEDSYWAPLDRRDPVLLEVLQNVLGERPEVGQQQVQSQQRRAALRLHSVEPATGAQRVPREAGQREDPVPVLVARASDGDAPHATQPSR